MMVPPRQRAGNRCRPYWELEDETGWLGGKPGSSVSQRSSVGKGGIHWYIVYTGSVIFLCCNIANIL